LPGVDINDIVSEPVEQGVRRVHALDEGVANGEVPWGKDGVEKLVVALEGEAVPAEIGEDD
jgi:hypothetical protein